MREIIQDIWHKLKGKVKGYRPSDLPEIDNIFFTNEMIEEYADYKNYKSMDSYKGDKGTLLYVSDLLYDYDGYNDSKNLKALIDEVRDIIAEQFKYGE